MFDLDAFDGEAFFGEKLRPIYPLEGSCAEKRTGLSCGKCIEGWSL